MNRLRQAWRTFRQARAQNRYAGLSPQEIFTRIYADGRWGGSQTSSGDAFCSGGGSHDAAPVSGYVGAVRAFLESLGDKPDVVDLGCGDFNIGSQIRPCCRSYVACDIVEPLILRNRQKFADAGVDFRVLDLTSDNLPPGDVLFVRQVLQHLSNELIGRFVAKLPGRYRHLVVTEHLPADPAFVPNLDKPTGPYIRPFLPQGGSGVVLTLPPFSLEVKTQRTLVDVPDKYGVIRTTHYAMP